MNILQETCSVVSCALLCAACSSTGGASLDLWECSQHCDTAELRSCRFARVPTLVTSTHRSQDRSIPMHFLPCSGSNFLIQFSALAHTQLFTAQFSMYILNFAASGFPQAYPLEELDKRLRSQHLAVDAAEKWILIRFAVTFSCCRGRQKIHMRTSAVAVVVRS